MKNYLYLSIFLVLAGLILVGCSQPSENLTVSKTTAKDTSSKSNAVKKEPVVDLKNKTANAMKVIVYKSPTCGCCTSWESHLEDDGFVVDSNSTDKMTEIRQQHKVPQSLTSCHTALVEGYVIEGHVPAADIRKLLKERPDIIGLAAPGMPKDSPGMQPKGEKPKGFDVLSFDSHGDTKVFTSY